MKKNDDVLVNFRIKRAVREKLQAIAAEKELTLSDILRSTLYLILGYEEKYINELIANWTKIRKNTIKMEASIRKEEGYQQQLKSRWIELRAMNKATEIGLAQQEQIAELRDPNLELIMLKAK